MNTNRSKANDKHDAQLIDEKESLLNRIIQFEAVLNQIAEIVGYDGAYSGVDTADDRLVEAVRRAVQIQPVTQFLTRPRRAA